MRERDWASGRPGVLLHHDLLLAESGILNVGRVLRGGQRGGQEVSRLGGFGIWVDKRSGSGLVDSWGGVGARYNGVATSYRRHLGGVELLEVRRGAFLINV